METWPLGQRMCAEQQRRNRHTGGFHLLCRFTVSTKYANTWHAVGIKPRWVDKCFISFPLMSRPHLRSSKLGNVRCVVLPRSHSTCVFGEENGGPIQCNFTLLLLVGVNAHKLTLPNAFDWNEPHMSLNTLCTQPQIGLKLYPLCWH